LAIGRGLPVPPGLVLTGDAVDASARDLAPLGSGLFAVRSSATFEDRPGVGAAGLLATLLDVAPDGIPGAVRRCRASLLRAHVAAYLQHRGIDRSSASVAVIVQAMVGPGRRGTFASLDPGGSGLTRLEEEAPDGPLVSLIPRERIDEPFRTALALEEDLAGPIEVEWAEADGRAFVLQVRPAPPLQRPEPFVVQFADERDRTVRWRWDREHNPDPLSPAQESLIALLAATVPKAGLRVWHGYLYVDIDSPGDASTNEERAREWRDRVVHELDAALAPWEAPGKPERDLEGALAFFSKFYGHYSPLARRGSGEAAAGHGATPAVERDRELWELARGAPGIPGMVPHLRDPAGLPFPETPEAAAWLAALRAHLVRWGAFAPAWDVAVATYGEDPRPLYPILARMAGDESPPAGRGPATGDAPRVVGEEDDLYFARALRVVRRALLGTGRAWVTAGHLDEPTDVFFVPLATLRAGISPRDARDQVRAARDLRARRARRVPPLSLRGEERHWPRPAGEVLTGFGVGGRARGPAFVWRDPERMAAPAPGSVLVVPTVSPTMTFLMAVASAVVTDHGGLLDHGAFMAREYGLPAVIGTIWGTRALQDGEEVIVDGEAGRVYRGGIA